MLSLLSLTNCNRLNASYSYFFDIPFASVTVLIPTNCLNVVEFVSALTPPLIVFDTTKNLRNYFGK